MSMGIDTLNIAARWLFYQVFLTIQLYSVFEYHLYLLLNLISNGVILSTSAVYEYQIRRYY